MTEFFFIILSNLNLDIDRSEKSRYWFKNHVYYLFIFVSLGITFRVEEVE